MRVTFHNVRIKLKKTINIFDALDIMSKISWMNKISEEINIIFSRALLKI